MQAFQWQMPITTKRTPRLVLVFCLGGWVYPESQRYIQSTMVCFGVQGPITRFVFGRNGGLVLVVSWSVKRISPLVPKVGTWKTRTSDSGLLF